MALKEKKSPSIDCLQQSLRTGFDRLRANGFFGDRVFLFRSGYATHGQ